MKVAVAYMADNRREQAHLHYVALCLLDALGKTRDRHADVGGNAVRSRTQSTHRPVRIVPCLPEPRSILWLGRPFEFPAAVIGRDLAKAVRLLLHARIRAVELQ